MFRDLSPNEAIGIPTEITCKYYISRKLGSGACGLVRLVYDRRSCQQFAMKIVKKNMLTTTAKNNHLNEPNRVLNEARIMKKLEHVRNLSFKTYISFYFKVEISKWIFLIIAMCNSIT